MVNYQMISSKKFQKILLKHCKALNRKVFFGVVRFLATSFGGAHNDEMRAEGFANRGPFYPALHMVQEFDSCIGSLMNT